MGVVCCINKNQIATEDLKVSHKKIHIYSEYDQRKIKKNPSINRNQLSGAKYNRNENLNSLVRNFQNTNKHNKIPYLIFHSQYESKFTYLLESDQIKLLIYNYVNDQQTIKNEQKQKKYQQLELSKNMNKNKQQEISNNFKIQQNTQFTHQVSLLIQKATQYLQNLNNFLQNKQFFDKINHIQIYLKQIQQKQQSIDKIIKEQILKVYENFVITENSQKILKQLMLDVLLVVIYPFIKKQNKQTLLKLSQNISVLKNPSLILQEVQTFYQIKLQISHFSLLKFDSKIQKIGISLIDRKSDKNISSFKIQDQLYIFDIQQIQNIKDKNQNQNPQSGTQTTSKKISSIFLNLIITPQTQIRFITYPDNSKFTLHALQFLRFTHINQTFKFTNTKNTESLNVNTPQFTQPEICASLNLHFQILSSNYKDSLQKLKLNAKNLIHQLQIIKKGQNNWEHINSLKSSFASQSENQSSFLSNNGDNKNLFCC